MIPATYNFKDHYKGSTFEAIGIKFNFDITGAEILCQIKEKYNYPAIHEWKTGVNISVTDLSTGNITLEKIYEFDPPAGTYIFDVQIDFPNISNKTYIRGQIKIIQDVSR
jgi:hypothetical protein